MKRPLYKNIKVMTVAVLAVIVAVTAWIMFFDKKDDVNYLTETATLGDIEQNVIATGEVASAQLVTVGAQVSGQILKLGVQLGQKIRRGELIAEIDSTTQLNELNTNKALLGTYKAQLVSREIALRVAQQQYDRELKLKNKDATSRENLENAENTLAAAKAQTAETKSLITQTQIAVSTSEANLGYTQISAPMDGTIVSVPVEEGQTVNANQTTPTIAQLADLSRMEIKIQISEGDVTKVAPDMPVTFSILSEPDNVYKTTLKSVDPGSVTLTSGQEQTTEDSKSAIYYYGRLLVNNDDGKLRIGMTTQSVISIAAARNVVRVPSLTVRERDGEKYVIVLENDKIPVERAITTGLSDNMLTEVMSGLQAGERVVSSQMTEAEISANIGGSRMRRR